MPLKLMLTTSTPPASSCGIWAISAVMLPPLSERESTAMRVLSPSPCSARRRLETSAQFGETARHASSSLAAFSLASSPTPTK